MAPGNAVAVQIWIARMDLLAVQVARRGGVVGNGPGDGAVEAPPQPRHAGVTGAGRVVLRSMDGVFVPARRQPERLVRVTAQQRVARRRTCAGDGPVVAARSIARPGQDTVPYWIPRGVGAVRRQDAILGRFRLEVRGP